MSVRIKLQPRFYTVEQLAERWKCSVADVSHQIEIGALETADKGAAREGKKQIRLIDVFDWDWYDALQHDDDFADALTVPIVNSPDSEEPYEELVRREMEKLADAGELDQVILASEVFRFEHHHSEPAPDHHQDDPNPTPFGPVQTASCVETIELDRQAHMQKIGDLGRQSRAAKIEARDSRIFKEAEKLKTNGNESWAAIVSGHNGISPSQVRRICAKFEKSQG